MKLSKIIPLSRQFNASIEIPGSKSYTNRALIMAALTKHRVVIKNPLFSDDTVAMTNCLQTLGIKVISHEKEIVVEGNIKDVVPGKYVLDAKRSGTTLRFMLALSTIVPGIKIIQGKDSLLRRPIGELVKGLRQLGAKIEYLGKTDYPPVKVSSQSLKNNTTRLLGDISSQYFSALLMIGPAIGGLVINVIGNQISKSYIDMTIDMMQKWGVGVENFHYQQYLVPKFQSYQIDQYRVEGDYSAAGYFLAIAALTRSKLTLRNLQPDSKQGDRHFALILENMGNQIEWKKNEITIIGKNVKPLIVNMEQCPDQAQTLAVISAFATGKTIITGVRSLRIKETERVKAIQTELKKMGIKTESPDTDTLIIYGGKPRSARISTYEDHRMAMSFAIAGAVLSNMEIENPDVVNKTFPTFWQKLNQIGIKVINFYDE